MKQNLPTTSNEWRLNLFNNTLVLDDVEYTLNQAKEKHPEDVAYLEWFWKTYAE